MPPRLNSRYEFTEAYDDSAGRRVLSERVPYRFRDLPDNRTHVVGRGETLWTIAHKFFDGLTDRPAGLWWIIADFQPDPIIDPTLRLEEGRAIVVPSKRTVTEEIFNPDRRVLF